MEIINMEKKHFFNELKEELELSDSIDGNTIFKNLEEWDSLTAMVLINFCSKNFEIDLTADDLEKIDSFDDLINIIGHNKIQ